MKLLTHVCHYCSFSFFTRKFDVFGAITKKDTPVVFCPACGNQSLSVSHIEEEIR